MVKLYSGTPGSGKSYHAARDIQHKLQMGKNVISTMPIDINVVNRNGKRKTGKYEFRLIQEITPKYLIEFAKKNHKIGKEGQTLIVIDECQILFNPRDYTRQGRSEWILFFSYHRHYGYDVILITQFDRLLDRQIRGMIENEYKHRKINNRGILFLLPVKVFAVIEFWYVNKTQIGAHFVKFKRSVSRIYNSYEANDVIAERLGVVMEQNTTQPNEVPLLKMTGTDAPAPARVEMGAGGPPSKRLAGPGFWLGAFQKAKVK